MQGGVTAGGGTGGAGGSYDNSQQLRAVQEQLDSVQNSLMSIKTKQVNLGL